MLSSFLNNKIKLLFWVSMLLSIIKLPAQNNFHHDYSQTLVTKLLMSNAKWDGKFKRRDNGESVVRCTIEQALEVIKKVDQLTLGIPKITYLVGWQYNGHDSKYPAWFEGNERLKRPQDKNMLESIKWLMKKAKKYNTTLSLHINMFDAYDDSPLWDTYVKNDIIAKNKDGSIKLGEWGSPISYAQEWKTGYAQKRIDSLCALLPIKEAGTIHIDAFHTWAPIGKDGPGKRPYIKKPISQYLDFTIADETNAQKHIFEYWASKGIDVTSEGSTFLREFDFEGYQPMAWWVDWGLKKYLKRPASLYTGGIDRSDLGKLFGSSMHGEKIVKNNKKNLKGYKKDFYLHTVPWYFLNRLKRLNYSKRNNVKMVLFSNGVQTKLEDKNFYLIQGKKVLIHNGDMLLPALWIKKPTLVAYSKNAYKDKLWSLPDGFEHYKKFKVSDISINGLTKLGVIESKNGKIKLSLKPDQAIALKPIK